VVIDNGAEREQALARVRAAWEGVQRRSRARRPTAERKGDPP
jgi:hypothetical protein